MTRRLAGLIRLQRWKVDEKRRAMAELQVLHAELTAKADALEAEVVAEQRSAAANGTEFAYNAYAEQVIQRRERLAESIADVLKALLKAQGELSDAYQEAKRYEMAQERAQQRLAAEAARREQIDLDEIGLNIHRRNQAGRV